jgi:hypothetical protein
MPWIRAYRERRAAERLVALLAALDGARERRRTPVRRATRASLGVRG